MVHRGEILQKELAARGIKVTRLANRLGVARNTLYYYFGVAQLDWDVIFNIAKVVGADLLNAFPDVPKQLSSEEQAIAERISSHPALQTDCWRQLVELEAKHNDLLKKYAALQEKHIALLESKKHREAK